MRMTAEEFEARAFFTPLEVIRASGQPGRTVRRWLHQAGVVRVNGGGGRVIDRARLEADFPELLEALRRRSVIRIGPGR